MTSRKPAKPWRRRRPPGIAQKIEGDNWVKHGESKEFYAVAQIGNAILE